MTDKYKPTVIKFLSDEEIGHLEQEVLASKRTYGRFFVTQEEFNKDPDAVFNRSNDNQENFTITLDDKPRMICTNYYAGHVMWEDWGERLLNTLQHDRLFSVKLNQTTWQKLEQAMAFTNSDESSTIRDALNCLILEENKKYE